MDYYYTFNDVGTIVYLFRIYFHRSDTFCLLELPVNSNNFTRYIFAKIN